MSDCIFCRIVAKEIPTDIIYEDDYVLAFKDINPQAPVHILVIPKNHVSSLLELPQDNGQLVGQLVAAIQKLANQFGVDQTGFRTVVNMGDDGGQTVHHLHFHLLGGRFMQWPPG